jgi:hypothetical protein
VRRVLENTDLRSVVANDEMAGNVPSLHKKVPELKAKCLNCAALIAVLACFSVDCVQVWSKPKEPTKISTTEARKSEQQRLLEVKTSERVSGEKLPLQFEENKGQADPAVQFISRGAGYTLFLTANEAVFVLTHQKPSTTGLAQRSPYSQRPAERALNFSSVLRMKLSGSNAVPQAKGTTQLPGTVNYFIGRDAAQWRTGIPTYSDVVYSGVYPGIDLHYYGNHRQLEYDFVLNPGADPHNIALNFDGAKGLAIDNTGNLAIDSDAGKVTLLKPFTYQMVGGLKKPVGGSYVLRPNHSVGVELGPYDPTKSLVVDPVLVYSSFLGGSGWDAAISITLDPLGNEYIGGFTISPDFPSASTAISAAPNGTCVGFVAKLDPTLTSVLYSSYLGGTDGAASCSWGDGVNGIAADSSGQAYTTGYASSSDFPTTASAFQPSRGTGASANSFLTKLAADGQSLLYSTYLGGSGGDDDGYAVLADNTGNAYVVGQATSPDFPLTPATAFQTIPSGVYPLGNGFLTQIDTTKSGANSLVFSTVLGGTTGDDAITGIALDSSQNAYLTGWTSSSDFPVTPATAFQSSYGAQSYCGFVTQLDLSKTGSSMLSYSTYLCGTNSDWGWGVAIDSNANVYVTGEAFSADFPSTFGQSNSPNGKGFAALFNPRLTGSASLLYSRLLGGNNSSFGDWPYRTAVDANGNAYVVGQTSSTDFPVTSDAFQSSLLSTTGDGFLTVLSPDGSTVLYATYLGGSGTSTVGGSGDLVYNVALDSNSNIYMVGQTISSDFPTTTNGLQTTYGGGGDAFVTLLGALSVPHVASVSPPAGAAGSLVTISGSGFGTVTGSVKIGGISAAVQSWTADAIVVQVPSSLAGSAQVAVTTATETSNSGHFSVETTIISRLSRTSGPIGARVTIFGSGFGPSQGSSGVTFNGVPAFVTSWSGSTIEILVPPDATTGSVMVTVGGTPSNLVNFRVVRGDFDKDCKRANVRDKDCDPKLRFLDQPLMQ